MPGIQRSPPKSVGVPSRRLEQGVWQILRRNVENFRWVFALRDGNYQTYYEKCYEMRDSSLEAIAEARKQ